MVDRGNSSERIKLPNATHLDTHTWPGCLVLCPSTTTSPAHTPLLVCAHIAQSRLKHALTIALQLFCVEENIGSEVLSHCRKEFMINVFILWLIWTHRFITSAMQRLIGAAPIKRFLLFFLLYITNHGIRPMDSVFLNHCQNSIILHVIIASIILYEY